MLRIFSILLLAAVVYWLAASPVAAHGKCTAINARCAVEIGGVCDPSTGHWSYGTVHHKIYGGNTMAFMACVDRNRGAQKR
jgi:hypothetical protein